MTTAASLLRFLVVEHSVAIYGGLIAALFAGVGVWLGLTITRKEIVFDKLGVNRRIKAAKPDGRSAPSPDRMIFTAREQTSARTAACPLHLRIRGATDSERRTRIPAARSRSAAPVPAGHRALCDRGKHVFQHRRRERFR